MPKSGRKKKHTMSSKSLILKGKTTQYKTQNKGNNNDANHINTNTSPYFSGNLFKAVILDSFSLHLFSVCLLLFSYLS